MNYNKLLISVAGEESLYALNTESYHHIKTDFLGKELVANGYGCLVNTDGVKQLAAIYAADESLYFFFKRSYRLDDTTLNASQKDGFFRSRFVLSKSGVKEIDIKYPSIDPESDIFIDVVDWLNTKPREDLLDQLSKASAMLSETDPARRRKLAMNKKPV